MDATFRMLPSSAEALTRLQTYVVPYERPALPALVTWIRHGKRLVRTYASPLSCPDLQLPDHCAAVRRMSGLLTCPAKMYPTQRTGVVEA